MRESTSFPTGLFIGVLFMTCFAAWVRGQRKRRMRQQATAHREVRAGLGAGEIHQGRHTMTNTPSDAEIEKLAAEHLKAFAQFTGAGDVWVEGEVAFARAVLAKWGTPQPVVREPLSVQEVEQLLAQWSYEVNGDRARYLVRMTEAAHGIKGGQHGTESST